MYGFINGSNVIFTYVRSHEPGQNGKGRIGMKFTLKFALVIIATIAVAATTGCVNNAQKGKFNEKNITLICPPKQGGLSDFITRTLAVYSEKKTGGSIVVENHPGASGATGMRVGSKAAPDGNTVTYVPVESTILLHRKDITESISYKDFDLLARLNYGPGALVVRSDSKFKTFKDFVDFAKKNPGKLNVGNSGNFAIWHIAAALMAEKTGIQIGHVPYDGSAAAVQDLLGGHLDAIVASPAEVFTFVAAKQLKILVMFDEKRNWQFKDIPVAKEVGYDIVVSAWGGLAVPKGTPKETEKRLVEIFKKGFDDPEFQEKCKERSVTLGWQGPDEFLKFAEEQDKMFADVLKDLKVN